MGKEIDIDILEFSIADILNDYKELVYKGTEEGLDVAQKILINNLKIASPKLSREFSKSWKGKKRKYPLRRYVGNTKMVKGKKGDIPLSNILEYSTTHGRPFIRDTYKKSIDEMANAVIKEIERGV